jgi:hypothetical protein
MEICEFKFTSAVELKARSRLIRIHKYSEPSVHRFRRGSEKETMDPGKQQMREP